MKATGRLSFRLLYIVIMSGVLFTSPTHTQETTGSVNETEIIIVKPAPYDHAKLTVEQFKAIYQSAGYVGDWTNAKKTALDKDDSPLKHGVHDACLLNQDENIIVIAAFKNLNDRKKFDNWLSKKEDNEYLFKNGAPKDVKTIWGEGLYHFAFNDDSVVFLLNMKVKPHSDKYGNTLLHIHVGTPSIVAAKKYKIDINARNEDGNTPLHNAWDLDAVKLLVKNGADVTIKNNAGETPAQNAYNHGHEDVYLYLKSLK